MFPLLVHSTAIAFVSIRWFFLFFTLVFRRRVTLLFN